MSFLFSYKKLFFLIRAFDSFQKLYNYNPYVFTNNNFNRWTFEFYCQNVLREEIKEKLTWNVDRSSPSNKIRDLMKWSRDILNDIYYQRKILSNPIATFFTKNWYATATRVW